MTEMISSDKSVKLSTVALAKEIRVVAESKAEGYKNKLLT